jgi:hypothetical protein
VNAERFRGIFSDTFVQLHFLLNWNSAAFKVHDQ